MTIRQLKAQARKQLVTVRGKLTIFLLPILLTFLINDVSSEIALQKRQDLAAEIFPLWLQLLLYLVTLSTVYGLIMDYRGLRLKKPFLFNFQAFEFPLVLRLFWLNIVKFFFLLKWVLPVSIGAILALLGGFATSSILILPFEKFILSSSFWISLGLFFLGLGILLLGWGGYLRDVIAYSQADITLMDYYHLGLSPKVNQALKESQALMSGYKWLYTKLLLSFVGWGLFVIMTGGLALVYVLPYYTSTKSAFYYQLREKVGFSGLTKNEKNESLPK